jgi:hypothetical protein
MTKWCSRWGVLPPGLGALQTAKWAISGIAEEVCARVGVEVEGAAGVDVAGFDAVDVVADFGAPDDDGGGGEVLGGVTTGGAAAAAGVGELGAGQVFGEGDFDVAGGDDEGVDSGGLVVAGFGGLAVEGEGDIARGGVGEGGERGQEAGGGEEGYVGLTESHGGAPIDHMNQTAAARNADTTRINGPDAATLHHRAAGSGRISIASP